VGAPVDLAEIAERFEGEDADAEEQEERLFALDLATGTWAAADPKLIRIEQDPCCNVPTPRLVRGDGAFALVVTDSGAEEATLSPDLRFVWAGRDVVATDDLARLAVVDAPWPEDLADKGPARAIARRSDGAFVTFARGIVAAGGEALFTVPFAVSVASFDAAGERLATIDDAGTVRVLAIGNGGRVTSSFAFDSA
jgi:hypothetical protein